MSKSNTQIYFRVVRAQRPHPFSGLYAVEKVWMRGNAIVQKEIVKEWDLRILTESALARFGGAQAYEEFVADNGEPEDITDTPSGKVVEARDPKEVLTSKRKLTNELKLKAE